jgi:hypothetical protein
MVVWCGCGCSNDLNEILGATLALADGLRVVVALVGGGLLVERVSLSWFL